MKLYLLYSLDDVSWLRLSPWLSVYYSQIRYWYNNPDCHWHTSRQQTWNIRKTNSGPAGWQSIKITRIIAAFTLAINCRRWDVDTLWTHCGHTGSKRDRTSQGCHSNVHEMHWVWKITTNRPLQKCCHINIKTSLDMKCGHLMKIGDYIPILVQLNVFEAHGK